MKFRALFLAVLASGAMVLSPEGASASQPAFLLAQAAPGRPAPAPLPTKDEAADELITIPAKSAGAARSAAREEATTVTLWKLIQDGGWAMVPLGFLSVVTVMLVLVYLFTLRRSAILTSNYMNTADVLLKKRDYLGLLAISSRHSEAVARVVQRTLDFATKNPNASFETIREIAETEGSGQAASLQHRVTYLADIGMLAPMIGLLGTVVGIIRAFAKLGTGDATISRDILLASGVSEALVATATGLILGILAMAFYSLFRNRVQSLISDLEIASAHVLGLIALAYSKKREPSRVAVDDEF
ncbi:MAG TPA: MotA/TolQ/ExbB proton channel family protein [Chthoniobacteraceae bacterium]|jgi:biopolymer transport protein ExbB|nr:MotA/TolQ/ExbB proton channel family protein [Chthoniobacteraceae bacterium]